MKKNLGLLLMGILSGCATAPPRPVVKPAALVSVEPSKAPCGPAEAPPMLPKMELVAPFDHFEMADPAGVKIQVTRSTITTQSWIDFATALDALRAWAASSWACHQK